jgi:hypothetical protein
MVFMDYENMRRVGGNLYSPPGATRAGLQLDPVKFAQRIIPLRNTASRLVQVRVFRGLPNAERQPGDAVIHQRQGTAWMRSGMVEALSTPLYYPPDYPAEPAQAGDVWELLAADLVEQVRVGACDVAVVASHNRSLGDAMGEAVGLRRALVEVAAWDGMMTRPHLPGRTMRPWCHRLDAEDWEASRDTRSWVR